MASSTVLRFIGGTLSTLFQIGQGGPKLKYDSAANVGLSVRNAADSAYENIEVGFAMSVNSAMSMATTTALNPVVRLVGEVDDTSTPTNTGTYGLYGAHTGNLGRIYFSNGTGSGDMVRVTGTPRSATLAIPNTDLATLGLVANTLYRWDGAAWFRTTSDAQMEIQTTLTQATKSTTSSVVAGSYIREVRVDVSAAYNNGATFAFSTTNGTLVAAGVIDPSVIGTYVVDLSDAVGLQAATSVVTVTIANGPTVGAGTFSVIYTTPAG